MLGIPFALIGCADSPTEEIMSKQVITIDGQDRVVSEDVAKSFRGIHWAIFTLVMMIVIAAILLIGGVIKLNTGSESDRPLNTPYSEQGP